MKRLMAGALLLFASFGAWAQHYSFNCITNFRASDCQIGKDQLGFALVDQGSSVGFLLSNAGPQQGTITDVYFDWSSSAFALTGGEISNGPGVDFRWGALPPNLPGGASISFSADNSAESNPSESSSLPNGVNPGEWVSFSFAGSYANLLAGLNSADLRVGVQFKGLASGGAESYVVTPVPEPETYAMLLAGLGLMAFVARRRRVRIAA